MTLTNTLPASGGAPVITALRGIPVAGRDSMLLNLSGAHGPCFTRNIVILTHSSGHVGVGEVPGVRDDSVAMQYFIPGWKFDNKRPSFVR